MKKITKKVGMILLAAVLMLGLAACGKEKTPKKEFTYVSEYVQLETKAGYIDCVASDADSIYLLGSNWDEESGQSTYLYRYLVQEGTTSEIPIEKKENDSISQMAIDAEGNLVLVVSSYEEITDESGEITDYKQTWALETISGEDGSILDTKEFTGQSDNSDYYYVQYFCIDGQGNFYFADGDKSVLVTDKDLKPVCEISVENWINNMTASKEGTVYISSYGSAGLEFKPIDLTKKELGDAVAGIGGYGNTIAAPGATKSLVLSNGETVSVFDLTAGTSEDLFQWLDVDINSNNLRYMGETADGRIWGLIQDYSGENPSTELLFVKKVKASEVEPKKELVYGALWINDGIKESIIKFNKTNEKYRITYRSYMQDDDYEAGLAQFNADLTSGNCPDIIDLSTINYTMYAEKGVFENLYPYMDKSGINRDDYLTNVFDAYEIDGKLYGVMPQFYLMTTMAKASNVGDIEGWTLSEMLDYAESTEAENLFGYGSRSDVFYYCIYNNIDEFINWETGECSFKGEDFIRTLEFAARFPEEYDYSKEQDGIHKRLHDNQVLLMQTSIGSVQEFQMYQGLFGEKIAYVGFPNSERKGTLLNASNGSVGISAKSKNKDGAWEFVQNMLSEEFQQSLISEYGSWGFPVKKSALEAQFALDMKQEYYTDENGRQVEQPKTTWGYDDFEMEIYAATQEEVDQVRAMLESADRLNGNINENLTSIITEESEAFFKGQKTAADTADVIQNRIQIYVNENR